MHKCICVTFIKCNLCVFMCTHVCVRKFYCPPYKCWTCGCYVWQCSRSGTLLLQYRMLLGMWQSV